MDYFSVAAGGNAVGGKHPGSGRVGLCSRERFKQLLRGVWRTHFTDGQAESLAGRYLVSAGHFSAKVRQTICFFVPHVLPFVLRPTGTSQGIDQYSESRPSVLAYSPLGDRKRILNFSCPLRDPTLCTGLPFGEPVPT